ncbi:LMBR1 domain-containing protein 2 homolog [Harmonia axyridis]|uniref:LMBR1 domain-containing protein 2 homolog n=1 Tax=Harmonia axyridis TaxID=115357 RepID=UPI001E2764A0|nr:LMBR1 domain-containing protein 2 homolog [Harmonia axyridis]
MSYWPLITKTLFSFILSSTVLYRYGNWFRHRIIITLVVLLAWNFSFLIIFALPLDVISTVYRQCEGNLSDTQVSISSSTTLQSVTINKTCQVPSSNVPDIVFPELWRTVYWSTQLLTWLVMPMMQSYTKTGDFSVKGKLKSALIDNAIYYGSYLLICIILMIYLALKPGPKLDWSQIKAIASSASNTWGLFLLVLLLGYALVEVPRHLWHNANRSYVLTHSYFKMAKLTSDKCEAEETVDDVLESLHAVSRVIKPGHYLYEDLETILQKLPIELKDRMNRRAITVEESCRDMPTEKSLIGLHKQVIKSLQVLQRTETQYNILLEKIFDLEDILKNQISRDRRFKKTFQKPPNWFTTYIYTPTLEWYWKCLLYGYMQKSLAVVAAVFSFCVVWSELTFFNKKPVLSIFALIVAEAGEKYDYLTIEWLSTAVILYLCYCAYSTILKIRLLNFYYLAPHHQTNEYSLIFSGMMLSRLTPPLCLNFLGLIHMDSHVIKAQVMETHYTQVMGHMDVIGIISNGFNIYFPMAILIFGLCTYFSLGSRLLSFLGFHQFVGDDEMTTDLVDEGREIVKREKRKRIRSQESSNRRKEFQERFPTTGRFRNIESNRPSTELEYMDNTKSNLLRDSNQSTYSGTNFSTADIDTRLPSNAEDIDSRFGASTGLGRDTDHRFSGYQYESGHKTRVGYPPRGIFDDV